MRIGFISDLHGSLDAWNAAMGHGLSDCDLVICCGDVLYHGPRNPIPKGYDPQGLSKAINGSGLRLILAKGNCDADVDQLLVDYPMQSPIQVVYNVGNPKAIIAHHGDVLKPEDLERHIAVTGAGLIVSGHTHLRVLDRKGGVVYLNPGSPSLPKTQDGMPSIAILDGDLLSIINPDDGSVIDTLTL